MALHAVRKITVREIIKGKPEKHKVQTTDADGKPIEVMQVVAHDVAVIYGQVHAAENKQSQFGPYIEFQGRMEARRLKDGDIFQSTRAILPQIAEDLANQAFLEAKTADPTAYVNMAFVIGVEHDPRGSEGYKFTCKPISTGEQTSDPLAALRAAMAPALSGVLGVEFARSAGLLEGPQSTDGTSGEGENAKPSGKPSK